ncbi:hypothetical protein AB0N89_20565 [Amycolatopsis sp. NPDC089917]|uniref:hypothetical protein n=1 Tax=Amycolatopsis sp. NPDC089917 TaxID=3155187 RepID=UPI003420A26D
MFLAARLGVPLNPVIAGTSVIGNVAGRGGVGGVAGLSVFADILTLDGGKIGDNAAGEPEAGSHPFPEASAGGGSYTLGGHATLANGAVVSGNRPDNCSSVADVQGCVNDFRAARAAGDDGQDRKTAGLATAEAKSAASSRR